MLATNIVALLALTGTASARSCQNITVTVPVSAMQPTFSIPVPQDNFDVTAYILNLTRQGTDKSSFASGMHTTSGTYNISTQFCTPDHSNGSQPVVQILIHGVGFDKACCLSDILPTSYAYPNGYIVWSDVEAISYDFFYTGYFDPELLVYIESIKQPITVGEYLTGTSSIPLNNFTGPVFAFAGEFDLLFCGGDCLNTGDPALQNIPAALGKSLPKAKSFETYIQPNTGHGLTTHYNQTAGYQVIQDWIAKDFVPQ